MSETNQIHDPKNMTRLLFLAGASLLLSLSMVLSVFAASPISLAAIFYSRLKAYSLGLVCCVIAFFVSQSFGMMYVFGFILSIFISEIVIRNLSPVSSLVKSGLAIAAVVFAMTFIGLKSMNTTAKAFVVEQIKLSVAKIEEQKDKMGAQEEEINQALMRLSNPENVADQILEVMPGYLFVSIFFVFWANLFLVLRSRRLILREQEFKYSEKDLLSFKVPEYLIWVVIPTLVVAIWGDEYIAKNSSNIAMTLIYGFGVFYFFQGFGIMIGLLDRAGIYGFIRTLLVMFIVVSMHWILAIVGLFDMWIDFSKLLQKKSN